MLFQKFETFLYPISEKISYILAKICFTKIESVLSDKHVALMLRDGVRPSFSNVGGL